MNFEFLTSFTPKIIDVVERSERFWQNFDYELFREKTKIYSFVLVYQGKGIIELNGQMSTLQPGTLLHICPDSYMKITTKEQETLRFYSIHFEYGTINWKGRDSCWNADCKEQLPFPSIMLMQENPVLKEGFETIYDTWNHKDIGYIWKTKLKFLNLLGILSDIEQNKTAQDLNQSDYLIGKVIEYMKLHLEEPISRNALAKLISVSPSYFSTLFKEKTGDSPMQYLLCLRIDRAKQLLRNTKMSVNDIAPKVGFTDSFYFSRMFTKEAGLSPRNFRKA
jgi:AraC-like DNA-binding protein